MVSLALAGCSATKKADKDNGSSSAEKAIATSAGPDGRPELSGFCGNKPLTVALVDGFGGNAWRKILRAEFEDEASQCSSIKDTIYLDANGDPQKYISGVDGLVAKGVDVIIGFDDFGSATLAALTRATKAGVKVVPYNADPGGKVGEDYTDFISVDYKTLIAQWVDWLDGVLKGHGKLLYVGGPAGNAQDSIWLATLKAELKEKTGLTLVQQNFLETKFDPASVQQAVAGAMGKYGTIDAMVSSYGTAMTGAVRAYENAGKPMPALATVASANELGCLWISSSPQFPLFSLDGTPELARIALRKGVAAASGIKNDEPSGFQVQPFMDSTGSKKPGCDKTLPSDADLSSSLPTAQLSALFAR
jgi:ribose transport system substrate-binding protein